MRAALYIRVSTEDQAKEGYSIEAQKDSLTKYALNEDWDIVDYYIDDGYSAKDMNRPQLQRLIQDIRSKKVDIVLVHKLDRLTRSVRDLYSLLEEFEKYNCAFYSRQERFDITTTMGRAMLGMLGIFAQWERETIAERVYTGMEQKHLSGERNGAIAPMGYDLIDGKLVPNKDADFVRRLFKMYLEHKGILTITRLINQEGYNFNAKTIYYILMNPVYCGKIRWNYRKNGKLTEKEIIVDGDHEPLISEEEFNRVQQIRGFRKSLKKAATSEYSFSGVLFCGRCGKPMIGGKKNLKKGEYRFYRCSSRYQKGKCDMPAIAEEAVTRAFLDSLLLNKKEISMLLRGKEMPKEQKNDLRQIERELAQIAKRKKRWQMAFANEAMTLEELKARMEEERKLEESLKERLKSYGESRISWTKEELTQQLIDLRKAWNEIEDAAAKKEFVHALFESIVVNTDEKPRPHHTHELNVDITWKIRGF